MVDFLYKEFVEWEVRSAWFGVRNVGLRLTEFEIGELKH